MLVSISCDKLIKSKLNFSYGLNPLLGSPNGENSIGKSSVLMLIDFAFGGEGFPKLCSDVIDHVGHLTVNIEFKFDNVIYTFVRTTDVLKEVYFNNESRIISKDEFTKFLAKMYGFTDENPSFRDSVNGFSRIYQKKNYNENNPLDTFSGENGEAIKKRSIKIFGYYKIIKELELVRNDLLDHKKHITSTFKSGVVNSITAKRYKENVIQLELLDYEISKIKNSIKNHIDNFDELVNDSTIELKAKKDFLYSQKNITEVDLNIINDNMSNKNYQGSKYFKDVVNFFPTVNKEKLAEIDMYHKGLTSILNEQFESEVELLTNKLELIDSEIDSVKNKLKAYTEEKNISETILNELLDKDKKSQQISLECELYNNLKGIKDDVKDIDTKIADNIYSSIVKMEDVIAAGLKKNVEVMYGEGAIIPTMTFTKKGYNFNHGDDRGTGKCVANMIALDLTYLEETKIPFIIHDSLLFKNIKSEAVSNLIYKYMEFTDKQIFIAIDELQKYEDDVFFTLELISFLTLSKDNLAFIEKWKNK
ncbi:DUF2326 domain-containing protein [Photobacterium sanguinicancri]|uniref:DUF2326 domain-containing protein n=1 Tax=Photobacterium sanguinicancri TaxID=875932 RepID=UPI0026E40AC2|nr:DUF2326 domain-containing protein [Photobacterium sanguinicancri]MDO6500462.1 DUF2326 domain-containing protein [Photobacterium sanguinicancri]